MTIGILGAGIQGCCCALELAEKGFHVDLFDMAQAPMTAASRWNEGKLHLGYVYANDTTMATARSMIASSCQFDRFFSEVLGQRVPLAEQSSNFIYGLHRDSLIDADRVKWYFSKVDELLTETLARKNFDYLGNVKCEGSSEIPVEKYFDDRYVQAAYLSPERSVDTHFVEQIVSAAVSAHPRITFYPGVTVQAIEANERGCFSLLLAGGGKQGRYKEVINATWSGRLALDASLGYLPGEPWLYRYKLAVHLTDHPYFPELPSCTFLLGPFGDLVNFNNGAYYLSWYPACKIGSSSALLPPDYSGFLDAAALRALATETHDALTKLVPALAGIEIDFDQAEIKGGHIFAWGENDISHMNSELHKRHRVGVFSENGYHSINTGKFGMAPLHAQTLAQQFLR